MIVETYSREETKNLGKKLATESKAGDIFCLVGDLGVGKTVFSKGFSEGLKIDEIITSPTFSILNVYDKYEIPFYHFDVYRINHINEMEDTGYEDYFYGDGVCLIEWADIVREIIPQNAVWITIEKDYNGDNENYRKIKIDKK